MNRFTAALLAAPLIAAASVPAAAALPIACTGPASLGPMDVRVVDAEGRPVAGVAMEFVDQPAGSFGEPKLPVHRTSDAAGIISTKDLKTRPLDLVVAANPGEAEWSVRFVHGHRHADMQAPVDLLGSRPRVYDTEQDIVCVVERTGEVHIEVVGAKDDERFFATFEDRRPEPESHRNVVAGGSFTGSTGTLRVPPGRGTLYLAQEGFLGAPVLTRNGPLVLSVTSGERTTVKARFLDAPTTKLLAPFDSIPFHRMEALTPDGETVVAKLAFDASPLRIESRFAVVTGSAGAPSELPTLRMPKHLLRAVDVPLNLPAMEDPDAESPAERYVDRAPMELIFPIDPGTKIRLPETQGGWIAEAQAGLSNVTGALYSARMETGITYPKAGEVLLASVGEAPEWSASVQVLDGAGAPQAFVEVLVSVRGLMLSRSVTNGEGKVLVRGLRADQMSVGLVDSVADQVTLTRPADGPAAEGEIHLGSRVLLKGLWRRGTKTATAGDLMVLIPADEQDMLARRSFMTRAAPIAFADTDGTFSFGVVPRGLYTLRAGRSSEVALDLRATEEGQSPVGLLELSGMGESFQALLSAGK